jgi:hypothetical protein
MPRPTHGQRSGANAPRGDVLVAEASAIRPSLVSIGASTTRRRTSDRSGALRRWSRRCPRTEDRRTRPFRLRDVISSKRMTDARGETLKALGVARTRVSIPSTACRWAIPRRRLGLARGPSTSCAGSASPSRWQKLHPELAAVSAQRFRSMVVVQRVRQNSDLCAEFELADRSVRVQFADPAGTDPGRWRAAGPAATWRSKRFWQQRELNASDWRCRS